MFFNTVILRTFGYVVDLSKKGHRLNTISTVYLGGIRTSDTNKFISETNLWWHGNKRMSYFENIVSRGRDGTRIQN